MITFLKIGQWTLNLGTITRLYDCLPEKNMVELESTAMSDGPIQFWNDHADAIRAVFGEGADDIINVIDLMPDRPVEDRQQTWDGTTMKEKHELLNVIETHKQTIATQSGLIQKLRDVSDRFHAERDDYATTALAGLSAFGCTPEKGYIQDGGVGLLAADFKRAADRMKSLYEAADRMNKANVGLLNQLIDIDYAARKLINGAVRNGGQEVVSTRDIIALRKAIGELRPDRYTKPEGATPC